MEIIVGKYSGFCNGVNNAVSKSYQSLLNNDKVYCLGELVHNEKVIADLKRKGMIFVNELDAIPNNSKVIFRAHGEPINTYKKAQSKNLDIIDLTCSKVKLIHKKIEMSPDYFIILIGKKNHPECIASISYAKFGLIVYEDDDLKELEQELKKTPCKKIYVLSQTTISSEKYHSILESIKKFFKNIDKFDNTICDATSIRQNETIEIAKKVSKLIVIGGKNSSNTRELENIGSRYTKTFWIQDVSDIKNISFSSLDIVGIVAGASTPNSSIQEVKEYLKNV